MKMIWRGSKANEHVLAVGEATEGASTENFLKKVWKLIHTFNNFFKKFLIQFLIKVSFSF